LKELEVESNGTIEDKEFETGKSLTDKHNVKIINCTFKSNKEDEDQLHLSDCQGCVILKCTFRDKHNAGVALLIDGAKSKNNKVVGCTFSDLTLSDEYKKKWKDEHGKAVNAEPIRLGGSTISGCWSGTTVSWCLFDKLAADVETVSIKSCGNVLENNIHNDCDSNFTIRHGGYNKIQYNLFKGSGGIRLYGYKNEIRGNYHENNNSDRPPLTVGTGTYENDPNFNDRGEPPVNDNGEHVNKKGCSHAVYARAKFNTIAENQYNNCKTCVYWDTGNNDIDEDKRHRECKKGDVQNEYDLEDYVPPTNNSFINNKVTAGNENKDSTFIKTKTPEGKPDITDSTYENTFQGNKMQNVKHGRLPEEPNDSVEPLTLSRPRAGPDEIPTQLEQELRSATSPPPTAEAGVDKYRIKKIYPDAADDDKPEHQYLDMNDIKAGRVDNYPATYKKSNEDVPGGFKAIEIGGDQVRLALYSSKGNPFGSVEHTVYFKFQTGPTSNGNHHDANRLFQPYIGGGSHHTDKDRCCEGNAMKVCIFGGGDIGFRKELCHDAYCDDRGHYNNYDNKPHGGEWNGPIKNMKNGAMLDRWYGFKQIEKHFEDRNRQEVWMDEGSDDGNGNLVLNGNQDRWRLITAYEDVKTGESNDGRPIGDWSADDYSEKCTGCNAESRSGKPLPNGYVRLEPFSVTHAGGHDIDIKDANCVVLRIDDKNAKIAYWSSRKIKP
jgi:Chondroitinase B